MRCEAKYLPQAENKFIYFVKAFFVRKASLFFALKLKQYLYNFNYSIITKQ